MRRSLNRRLPAAKRSRGVSLIFSLLALVGLSLAAVALIRAVNTGSGILGNLGFKQDALMAADDATRQAIEWLNKNLGGSTLHATQEGAGYHALNYPRLDPLGSGSGDTRALIDWNADGCKGQTVANCLRTSAELNLSHQVKARYVILRLCDGVGDPTAPASKLQCATPLKSGTAGPTAKNTPTSTNPRRVGSAVQSQYFRILVRAESARKTYSYTDTVVHF